MAAGRFSSIPISPSNPSAVTPPGSGPAGEGLTNCGIHEVWVRLQGSNQRRHSSIDVGRADHNSSTLAAVTFDSKPRSRTPPPRTSADRDALQAAARGKRATSLRPFRCEGRRYKIEIMEPRVYYPNIPEIRGRACPAVVCAVSDRVRLPIFLQMTRLRVRAPEAVVLAHPPQSAKIHAFADNFVPAIHSEKSAHDVETPEVFPTSHPRQYTAYDDDLTPGRCLHKIIYDVYERLPTPACSRGPRPAPPPSTTQPTAATASSPSEVPPAVPRDQGSAKEARQLLEAPRTVRTVTIKFLGTRGSVGQRFKRRLLRPSISNQPVVLGEPLSRCSATCGRTCSRRASSNVATLFRTVPPLPSTAISQSCVSIPR